MDNITNLIRIPDSVKVFAKYMEAGKTFYSRCHFIAIDGEGIPCFAELNDDTAVDNPEDMSNCIGFEIVDADGWLSAEEFHKRYKPDEYRKFMELMEG